MCVFFKELWKEERRREDFFNGGRRTLESGEIQVARQPKEPLKSKKEIYTVCGELN